MSLGSINMKYCQHSIQKYQQKVIKKWNQKTNATAESPAKPKNANALNAIASKETLNAIIADAIAVHALRRYARAKTADAEATANVERHANADKASDFYQISFFSKIELLCMDAYFFEILTSFINTHQTHEAFINKYVQLKIDQYAINPAFQASIIISGLDQLEFKTSSCTISVMISQSFRFTNFLIQEHYFLNRKAHLCHFAFHSPNSLCNSFPIQSKTCHFLTFFLQSTILRTFPVCIPHSQEFTKQKLHFRAFCHPSIIHYTNSYQQTQQFPYREGRTFFSEYLRCITYRPYIQWWLYLQKYRLSKQLFPIRTQWFRFSELSFAIILKRRTYCCRYKIFHFRKLSHP